MNKYLPVLLAFLFAMARGAAGDDHAPSAAAASMENKIRHVQNNGTRAHPDPAPTVFTETEINAYLASGRVDLPAGVQSVRLQGQPGAATANLRVDFDQLNGGESSFNPLLAVFTGVHDVVVVTHGQGRGGQGVIHVDSVSLDGVEIPRFALELFVENYLKPRYPLIGLDSSFRLPCRIDSVKVAEHKATLIQK